MSKDTQQPVQHHTPPAPPAYVRPPQIKSVSKLQGIPAEPGQTLQDIHPAVIKQWFNALEARWKLSYANKSVDGQPANLSMSRG